MLPPDPPEPTPDEVPPPAVVEPLVDGAAPTAPVATPTAPVAAAGRSGNDRTLTVVAIALVAVAVLGGAALFLSGYSLGRQAATTPGTPVGEEELFQPFWDTYRAISERYAGGDVDQKALVEGAIKGMVEALGDPYSSYLTPDEYKQSLEDINGQFEGIGAEIGTKAADGSDTQCATLGSDCHLVIIAPIAGSPAERAGIRPGDIVLAVDGSTLDGLSVDEARDRIRGPKGTEVVLSIQRGDAAPSDVSITRDVIEQKEVQSRDLADGDVLYIRVTGFSSDAATDVEDALRKGLAAGQKKIVLDLRGNPGGFVDAARDIASEFIASGPIYWQEDAQGHQVETDATPGGLATGPDIKLMVLVDGGSASASEIVAGALQDTGRGTLVGQQTFGKGTVQQWTSLAGDNGGFRLTIAKWLTPDKRWIHHTGLSPDVVVEVPADTPADQDPVLDKALELLDETAVVGQLQRAA